MCQLQRISKLTNLPYEWFLDNPAPAPGEMAGCLGLSEDTILMLTELAEHEPGDVLDAMDDAVYAVVDAIQTAREARQ